MSNDNINISRQPTKGQVWSTYMSWMKRQRTRKKKKNGHASLGIYTPCVCQWDVCCEIGMNIRHRRKGETSEY